MTAKKGTLSKLAKGVVVFEGWVICEVIWEVVRYSFKGDELHPFTKYN